MELLKTSKSVGFKPIFLFTDHEGIEVDKGRKETACKLYNNALVECERVLERKLDKAEIEKILKNRFDGFMELVLAQIGFPNASMESAFGLIGKDPGPVKTAIEKIGSFDLTEMEITSKGIELKNSFLKDLERSRTYYTTNERQNKAMAIANDLSAVLNRAMQADLLAKIDQGENSLWNNMDHWSRSLKGLVTIQDGKVVPNVVEIWRIKE